MKTLSYKTHKITLKYTLESFGKDGTIFFFPGTSGNAESQRYDFLKIIAKSLKFDLIRTNFGFQQNNDKNLTLQDCIQEVKDLFNHIKPKNPIIFAKSLGAWIIEQTKISGIKIYLSPYFLFKPLTKIMSTPIKDLSLDQITLYKSNIIDDFKLIFIGTKDTIIPNKTKLTLAKIDKITLIILNNATHSVDKTHKEEIIKTSLEYITKTYHSGL